LAEKDKDDLDDEFDMLFDDFVMIDKEEINDRLHLDVSKEKLAKEEKEKNSSQSELLHSIKDTSSRPVKLEDFKIKRVIDKGSFGKVFLVVNSQDNKVYAMKRINKDILIEKGQIINTRTEKDILTQAKNAFIINMSYVF